MIGQTLIHGTCFITGDGWTKDGERDSQSLTDEQIKEFTGRFISSVVCAQAPSEDESEDMIESSIDFADLV